MSIPSSKHDDDLLTTVTVDVCNAINNSYIFRIPDTWNFECGPKRLTFKDIKRKMINEGISPKKAERYYGVDSSIITDSHIIYLTMKVDGKTIRKPLFLGEIKKQGTNDVRVAEGKKKQAIGNAAPDRISKNFLISSDFCYLSDKELFPYTVFLHGCDFNDVWLTNTMLAKIQPFFGELNKLNPFFDKDVFWNRRGGSCFFQGDNYTYEQLYKICYECCEVGVKHFLKKYSN